VTLLLWPRPIAFQWLITQDQKVNSNNSRTGYARRRGVEKPRAAGQYCSPVGLAA
jgi:hypothetical protein